MKSCCLAGALALLLLLNAFGTDSQDHRSSSFSQPALGFVFDPNSSGLRPIWGIAGVSNLGEILPLGAKLMRAWVSPRQNYALAESLDCTELLLVTLEPGPVETKPIAGSRSGADKIAISPTGTAALLYFEKQRRIELLTGLPQSATFGAAMDLSALPGALTSLAVSDEGQAVLIGVTEESGGAVYVARPGGELQKISVAGEPTALSFFPQRLDGLLADRVNSSVWLLKDILGAAIGVQLAGESNGIDRPIAVASSDDSQRIFVANSGSNSLATLELATGRLAIVQAGSSVSGLHRLKGDSVFRITELSDRPLLILDGGTAETRVVFVPRLPGSHRTRLRDRSQSQPLRIPFPRK
jgi:hypothetical protein